MRSDVSRHAALLAIVANVSGCVIDDRGGARGSAAAPAASVPDAGGPARRESAAKTLNDAGRTPPAGGAEGEALRTAPSPPAQ